MRKPKRRWIFVAAHCFICVVRGARFLLQQMVPDLCCGTLLVKFPFSLIETNPQLRKILDAFQAKMGARLSKEIALAETKSGVAFNTVSLLLGVSGRQTTRPRSPHTRCCALHRSPPSHMPHRRSQGRGDGGVLVPVPVRPRPRR